MSSFTTIFGLAAAILTTASNVPQVLKCWKTGATDDLSLKMLIALSSGLALWVAYGAMQGDLVIVVANAIGFVLAVILLILKLCG
jgi:MtN3 and saliva related transmembrane protein